MNMRHPSIDWLSVADTSAVVSVASFFVFSWLERRYPAIMNSVFQAEWWLWLAIVSLAAGAWLVRSQSTNQPVHQLTKQFALVRPVLAILFIGWVSGLVSLTSPRNLVGLAVFLVAGLVAAALLTRMTSDES